MARRRQRRRVLFAVGAVCAVVAVGGGLVAGLWFPGWLSGSDEVGGEDVAADAAAQDAAEALPDQQRLLLATVPDDGAGASSVTVLAGPVGDTPASMLFLPTGTLASIPGFGLERLGRAQQYGGAALLTATVENTLGVRMDATAVATHEGFAAFLYRAGELTVELDQRLVDREDGGGGEVRFESGQQQLDGERLVELWTFRSADDELTGAGDRRLVLDTLFDAAGDEEIVDRLAEDGAAPLQTEAGAEWMREFFGALAGARADGSLRAHLLPVESFGSADGDGGRAYRLEAEAAEELVGSALGRADIDQDGPLRVQVLNGVGVPGVGQLVDGRLPEDARITLTGNASSFDFTETRILVYTEEAAAVREAERVQDALGLGTIQVSRQPQSVVDITIVVGETSCRT